MQRVDLAKIRKPFVLVLCGSYGRDQKPMIYNEFAIIGLKKTGSLALAAAFLGASRSSFQLEREFLSL